MIFILLLTYTFASSPQTAEGGESGELVVIKPFESLCYGKHLILSALSSLSLASGSTPLFPSPPGSSADTTIVTPAVGHTITGGRVIDKSGFGCVCWALSKD